MPSDVLEALFPGFDDISVEVKEVWKPTVTIRGLRSNNKESELPPLLLLHGFPQNLQIWHRIAPRLTDRFQVILIDLRGYGTSSKPDMATASEPEGEVSLYAKSRMARDCVAVMDSLGFASKPFFVCAHDRGARVAHKLAVDFPERVSRLLLLDICPTLAMYTKTDMEFAKAYWHWFFLIQPAPLPEKLIAGDPKKTAEMFLGGRPGDGLSIFDARCYQTYVKSLEDTEGVHAMCQDYRAGATVDLDEARKDLEDGRLVKCPLVVLWGQHGVIERCFDALKEWREVVAENVCVEGRSVESGHYIPEEAPDEVVAEVIRFLEIKPRTNGSKTNGS